MTRIHAFQDQLRQAFEGTAWHGPSLKELLSDVTAQDAARRTIPSVHTIWEIVRHIGVWEDVVRRRLEGEEAGEVPASADWPDVSEQSSDAWEETKRRLEQGHTRLCESLQKFHERGLDEKVRGAGYSIEFMLHGIALHDAYHAGQVAMLRKALSS